MSDPTPPEGLDRYDDLPPSEAVVLAWTELPDAFRNGLRRDLPVLARALDRLTEHERTPPNRRRPHFRRQPPLWQETGDEETLGRPALRLDGEEDGLAEREPLTKAELEEAADEWVQREMRDRAEARDEEGE